MLCGWIALAAASLLRDSPASMLSGSFVGHTKHGDDVSMIMSEHGVPNFHLEDGETLRPGIESDEERNNLIAEMGDLPDSTSGEGATREMLDRFREQAEQDRQQDKYDPIAQWAVDDIDVTQDMLDNLEKHGALRPGSTSVRSSASARDSASAGSRPAVRTESKPSSSHNAPGRRPDVAEASVSPTGVVKKEVPEAKEVVDARIKAARKELGMGTQCYFGMNGQPTCSEGNTCSCKPASACKAASYSGIGQLCRGERGTCCQDPREDTRRLEAAVQRLAAEAAGASTAAKTQACRWSTSVADAGDVEGTCVPEGQCPLTPGLRPEEQRLATAPPSPESGCTNPATAQCCETPEHHSQRVPAFLAQEAKRREAEEALRADDAVQTCGWTTTSPDGNSPGRVEGSCVAEGACPTDGRLTWPGKHPTCTRDAGKSFCCENDGNYKKRKEAVRAWEVVDARIKAARKELGMGTQCYFSQNFQKTCSDGNTCTCMAKSACAGASMNQPDVCGESESTCCQDTGEDKQRLEEAIQRLAAEGAGP